MPITKDDQATITHFYGVTNEANLAVSEVDAIKLFRDAGVTLRERSTALLESAERIYRDSRSGRHDDEYTRTDPPRKTDPNRYINENGKGRHGSISPYTLPPGAEREGDGDSDLDTDIDIRMRAAAMRRNRDDAEDEPRRRSRVETAPPNVSAEGDNTLSLRPDRSSYSRSRVQSGGEDVSALMSEKKDGPENVLLTASKNVHPLLSRTLSINFNSDVCRIIGGCSQGYACSSADE